MLTLQNKQEVPDLSLPVGVGADRSTACGGLCSPKSQAQLAQLPADQRAQRASLCVFPGGVDGTSEDGTCKKYSCQHYSKSECAGMQQMLLIMEPSATPADHFKCETLGCAACPYQVRYDCSSSVDLPHRNPDPPSRMTWPRVDAYADLSDARPEWVHVRRFAG